MKINRNVSFKYSILRQISCTAPALCISLRVCCVHSHFTNMLVMKTLR